MGRPKTHKIVGHQVVAVEVVRSGPAVVPGKPDASLVVQALRYETYEMPPKGKLPASVVTDFETWIKLGAADPREGSGSGAIVIAPPSQIDT